MLPRLPNNRASLEALCAMPIRRVILAFLTWRMRLIPARPRVVTLWSGGVTPAQFQAARAKLRPLLEKVVTGRDLTPHLSDYVKTAGIVLPGARAMERREDIDTVLIRHGLHHFHSGVAGPGNPKGRSGNLVFAEVLEGEFRIVAIADHHAFKRSSPQQLRLFEICQSYIARGVPPGQGFMANPVMSSGHPAMLVVFADRCETEILRLDPLLDDPAFIDNLYNGQPIIRDGQPVARPVDPSLAWYFNDLTLGILDRRTLVFFCIFPFFAR